MFVCEGCSEHLKVAIALLRSRGACEICGRVTSCYDLPPNAYKRKTHRDQIKTRQISKARREIIVFNGTEYCHITIPSTVACYIEIDGVENHIRIKGERHVIDARDSTDTFIQSSPTTARKEQ